jgi:hypothetical protein
MLVVGIGWYVPEEWARVKATAVDSQNLDATFAEWESMATANFEIMRKQFPNLIKVFIVADEFFFWCHLHGQPNNSHSRSEFVAHKVETMV